MSFASVMILGGYGNFGKRIAKALALADIPLIIAGRDEKKAKLLLAELPGSHHQIAIFDAHTHLDKALAEYKPHVLIHTAGPFQGSNYNVAESCIKAGVHYLDLADGRNFVTEFSVLDSAAKAAGISAISGASTVPALSSAVITHFLPEFSQLDEVQFGISPGQKAERGLATTQGILSYLGKPLKAAAGKISEPPYGWQDIHRIIYPALGKRWMANCDIPDMDLLPAHFGLKRIQFSAGMENSALHLGMWFLSWLVRAGLPLTLQNHAESLLKMSHWFDRFGSDKGGMHIFMRGLNMQGKPSEKRWFIIAHEGHGPHIPTIPAIVLAKKLANSVPLPVGAYPCIAKVTLEEYLAELHGLAIETYSA